MFLAGDALPADIFWWQDYNLSWTSTGSAPTLGSTTVTARYMRLGQLVVVRVAILVGSGFSAGSGVYLFSLPAPPDGPVSGAGNLLDAGSAVYAVSVAPGTATQVQLLSGTTQVGAGSPFTATNGDAINFMVVYEAA